MPRRLKKIKGGLNSRYVEQIRNLDNPNNLKTLDELRLSGLIQLRNIDGEEDFYFIDETGNIITDPILLEPIKYEDAFLLDNYSLFNVFSLHNYFHVYSSKKNPETNISISESAFGDINKIKDIVDMRTKLNEETRNKLEDLSSFNNLKKFEDLLVYGLLKLHNGEYYFVDDSGKLIIDRFSNKPIRYKHGFLIGNYLYDINSLVTFNDGEHPVLKDNFNKTSRYHDANNQKKVFTFNKYYIILLLDPQHTLGYSNYYKDLIDRDEKPGKYFSRHKDLRTFRPLGILIQLGLADEDGYLIGIDDNRIKSQNKSIDITYSNAILLEGYRLEYIDSSEDTKNIPEIDEIQEMQKTGLFPHRGGKCNNKYLKNIKELNKLKPFKELKKAGILKYVKIDENDGYLLIKCKN